MTNTIRIRSTWGLAASHALLALLALPATLAGLAWLGALTALGLAERAQVSHGAGWLLAPHAMGVWSAKAAARWRWSTAVGCAVLMHPSHLAHADTARRVAAHEAIHVEQFQAACVLGALLSLALAPWLGWGAVLVWASSWKWMSANWLHALLSGADAYRGALHERHARAEADVLLAAREEG